MQFLYTPAYDLGFGLPVAVHGFVLNRPSRTRAALIEQHGVLASAFAAAPALDITDFARTHSARLLEELQGSSGIARAVEMPPLRFLPAALARSAVLAPQMAAAGGTVAALRMAAEGGWVANLSGGFHHARPDRAHGFCLVNDVAVAVALLRAAGTAPQIAVIDLDAHQGDGNAEAFADDDKVWTVSLHEEALFPKPKLKSTIDVGLSSHMRDTEYLDALEAALRVLGKKFHADVIVYVAGVDPHVDDPLSSLQLTKEGLVRRDERIARFAREQNAGLVVLPAGGYTKDSPGLAAAGMAAIAHLAP